MSGRWQPIKPGESIYVVAPAARTPAAWDELHHACDLIRAAGFIPEYDKAIFADGAPLQDACGFAASDEDRYRFFLHAVESDSRLIWCFRGGYGSDRVAERLYRDGIRPRSSAPKLLVGFSDITVLHHYCHIHWGWTGLHAPVLHQLAKNNIASDDVSRLWAWLKGDAPVMSLPLQKMNGAAEKVGMIHAALVGGNLTVIQSSMGTPWEMPRDGIVFFEDVNEVPYRIARVLQQWLSSDWLRGVRAVIFGDFIGKDVDQRRMDEVLFEFADRFSHPVLRCSGIGHGERHHPLPMGVPARLSLGEPCALTVG